MHIFLLRKSGVLMVLQIVSVRAQLSRADACFVNGTSCRLNLTNTIPANGTFKGCILAPEGTRFSIVGCRERARHCPGYPIIPYDWIEPLCGSGYGPYTASAVFPELITWIVPLFSLMLNIHFTSVSPHPATRRRTTIGWLNQKIFTLWPMFSAWSTQLADPISATWSLAAKLDFPRQLYRRWNEYEISDEDRILLPHVFNILWCVDDFGKDLCMDLEAIMLKIIRRPLENIRPSESFNRLRNKFINDVEKTSQLINFARNRSWRRSIAAVLVYLATMVYAILNTRGATVLDDSTPHTIALREIYLFVTVHLAISTTIGAWSDTGNPKLILRSFAAKLQKIEEILNNEVEDSEARRNRALRMAAPRSRSSSNIAKRLNEAQIEIFDGGSYFFQPRKMETEGCYKWIYLFLSIVSLGSTFAISFCTSYFTPTKGVGGRALAELCYLSVWILNFLLNSILSRYRRSRAMMIFQWTKDGFISSVVFMMWFLPFAGWYNTAKSWSAWFSLGDAAFINLELNAEEMQLTYKAYLALLLIGLSLQVLLALTIHVMTRVSRNLNQRPEAAEEALRLDHQKNTNQPFRDRLGTFEWELTPLNAGGSS